jgi:hypothetical protein
MKAHSEDQQERNRKRRRHNSSDAIFSAPESKSRARPAVLSQRQRRSRPASPAAVKKMEIACSLLFSD